MTTPANPAPPATGTAHAPGQAAPVKPAAPAAAKPTAEAAATTNGQDAETKKAKKTGVSRPRLARPDENHVITVLRPNAKTGKSGQRFDRVKTGMTVKEYVDLMTGPEFNRTIGQAYHTLRWDTDPNRKLLNIGPTVVDVPPPPEPKVKAPKKAKEAKEEPAKPAA